MQVCQQRLRVFGNAGAAKQHEAACNLAKVRNSQLTIRPMASMLGLFQRPQLRVEDADKMARQQSLPARVAELPPEKKEKLKFTKSGKVDMRTFNAGATTRTKYSPLFKARVVRAYDDHANWDDVTKDLGMRLQETMLSRCGERLANGILKSDCKSCPCGDRMLTDLDRPFARVCAGGTRSARGSLRRRRTCWHRGRKVGALCATRSRQFCLVFVRASRS